jgi:hypothetical protein
MKSYNVYMRAERSIDENDAQIEAEKMRESLPSDELSHQPGKKLSFRWMVQVAPVMQQVAPVIKKRKTLDPVLRDIERSKLPVKEKKIAKPRPPKTPLKPRPQQKRRRRILIGMPKTRKARLPIDTSKLLALIHMLELQSNFDAPAPSTEGNADDDFFGHPEVSVP